jgi:hypothetical protein
MVKGLLAQLPIWRTTPCCLSAAAYSVYSANLHSWRPFLKQRKTTHNVDSRFIMSSCNARFMLTFCSHKRPVQQTVCGAVLQDSNWKCLILSLLIYGCLGAVTWCRLTEVSKVSTAHPSLCSSVCPPVCT